MGPSLPDSSTSAERDHLDRYGYLGWENRPALSLPDGNRIAVWVVVNHEVYELVPPANPVRTMWPRSQPDVLEYGRRDYGNRIGIWRVIDLLAKHDIRGSLNINVAALDHFPEAATACIEQGWEVFSHGIYNSRFLFGLSEPQEREVIADCIATISRHTGQEPRGWMGPMGTMTLRTLDLIAELGFLYTVELFHEDVPAPVRTQVGRLVSVPYSQEVNDIVVLESHGHSPETYERMLCEQFDRLYREGSDGGVVMCIPLHPFLIGHPHRIAHLDRVLSYIRGHDDVWMATGEEIASWYMAEYYDDVRAKMRDGRREAGNA